MEKILEKWYEENGQYVKDFAKEGNLKPIFPQRKDIAE